MTPAPGIDVAGAALAAGLAVAAAGAIVLGLSWTATPRDFKSRLAVAEAKVAKAEVVLETMKRPLPFSRSAICAESAPDAAATLKSRITALAGIAGTTLTSLATTPAEAPDGSPLTPVDVQLEATGRYDQIIGFLSGLSRQTPTVFVSSAALASQVSSVDLKVQGRIYCSARL